MNCQISKTNLISKLQNFTVQIQENKKIVAFFLFGSYVTGKATSMSDVDFAFLLDKSIKRESYLPEKLRIMGELSISLGVDKLDVVILNEAPPGIGYRVIKEGHLLHLREEKKSQLIKYKVRTLDQYFDYKPVQRLMSEGLKKRIKEGEFGGR